MIIMRGLFLHSDAITARFLFLSVSLAPAVSAHGASAFWCFQILSLLFAACTLPTRPSFICFHDDVSALPMPSPWLNGRHRSTPLTHQRLYTMAILFMISQRHRAKKSGCLKFFLFPNVMAILSWIVSPPNSCVPRTTACELIWKWVLYRCNKLKWGHTAFLIQWLVSL